MLQGDEGILQSKKKFQKRPALKRTWPLEMITEEESNSSKPSSHRGHKTEPSLESVEENL